MASEVLQLLSRSPLDSARFGMEVWRGHVSPDQIPQIWPQIVRAQADVAIFRVPAEHISAMATYSGPRDTLLHADTLVYYAQNLKSAAINPLSRDAGLYRPAVAGDDSELREVTKRVFADYQNHYHANPEFSREKVLAGYAEWAANHLIPGGNTRSWVAINDGAIVGFICCSIDDIKKSAEIILNGVLRDHAGQGIYADLVRIAQQYFLEMQIESLSVSTQVGNYAVQRVWAREGLRLFQAYDTWHVNAMLSRK